MLFSNNSQSGQNHLLRVRDIYSNPNNPYCIHDFLANTSTFIKLLYNHVYKT